MTDVLNRDGLSRNGTRHGDVSYVSLAVADGAAALAFYESVLGWHVAPGPGDSVHAGQVAEVVPEVGLVAGPYADGRVRMGATLAFRVDDLDAALEAVTAAGGTATGVEAKPYGLESFCTDGQGLEFYLHQLPAAPPGSAVGENGRRHGDVSYIVVNVADRARAMEFFQAVLGWGRQPAQYHDGVEIVGPAPMIGLAEREPGVTLCYRVDDIAAAVQQVRASGGSASDPETRPYGIESDCTDDQGIRFYLHEFAT